MKQAMFVAALGLSLGALGCEDVEGDLTSDRSIDHPGPFEEPVGDGLPDNGEGVIRRVEVRNPLGTPAGNLLADGDFELSILPYAGDFQYPWTALRGNGLVELEAETGGMCRTGLRCAVLESNTLLLGAGTSAGEGTAMEASVWVKPEQGQGCELMDAAVLDGTFEFVAELTPPEAPDPAGWCRYSALVPAQQISLYLYVDASKMAAGQTALIDSATLLPTTTSKLKSYQKLAPSQAMRDHVAWVREIFRRRRSNGHVERPRPDEGP